MSRDAFLSEALYEADKVLEKFAWKVRCSATGVRFILWFCVVWVLTASIFVYICFVDCCIAALLQTVK